MHYGIYEEPKFTQNAGYLKTKTNIRYDDDFKNKIDEDSIILFLCGISTTLNTFREMKAKLVLECGKPCNNLYCYSLIQVLPDEESTITNVRHITDFECKPQNLEKGFMINKNSPFDFDLSYNDKYVYSSKSGVEIASRYLAGVKSKWHSSIDCELCNSTCEKPLICTSETSVIPAQMIKAHWYKSLKKQPDNDNVQKIDLFKRDDGVFRFWNYLYYGHIDRMDHHYVYYVRNSHLIKAILDNQFKEEKIIFDEICKTIRKELFPHGENNNQFVDIIVFPSESGDEVFPSIINKLVFNNNAHTISVDPNKEFRSNFGTKHSNIVYFIEQAKANSNVEIRFHYVAKHLVGAETFSRIKSLVISLMDTRDNNVPSQMGNLGTESEQSARDKIEGPDNRIKIFSDIIVFLNRNSISARTIYVKDINKYYSFIDINVPSIRRYGDACPMCKLTLDVQQFENKSMLSVNSNAWAHKCRQYDAKSIEDAKIVRKEQAVRFVNGLSKEIDGEILSIIDANDNASLSTGYIASEADSFIYKTIKELEGKLGLLHAAHLVDTLFDKSVKSQLGLIEKTEKEEYIGILANELIEKFTRIANQRYFRRFYLENHLFKCVKDSCDEENYESQMMKAFFELYPDPDAEALISFVKVITSPFLYYQECEKSVALKTVSNIVDQLIDYNGRIFVSDGNYGFEEILMNKNDITTYLLLVVCLNCLSKIDSTYLLSTEKIVKLCETVESFDVRTSKNKRIDLLKYGDIDFFDASTIDITHNVPGFLSCVVNNCKRIICGISGEARAYNFELLLVNELNNPSSKNESIQKLLRILYLENTTQSKNLENLGSAHSIIEKYQRTIVNEISKGADLDGSTQLSFVYFINTEKKNIAYSLSEESVHDNHTGDLKHRIENCLCLDEKISFENNDCLIYLCSNVDLTSHMVMNISFQDDPQKTDNLMKIRKCLAYYKDLIKILKLDLANNSIQLAISNKEANSLMSSGKIASHGSFAETSSLSSTIAFLIERWDEAEIGSKEKELFFLHACKTISSFMDRCISFGGIKQYVVNYAATPNPDNSLFGPLKKGDIFSNFCLPLTRSPRDKKCKPDTERRFLKEYFSNIINKQNSAYWIHVSEYKRGDNYSVSFAYVNGATKTKKILKANDLNYIDELVGCIYNLDVVPAFLNSASFDNTFHSIFLVGILEAFLRNIYDHSGHVPDVKMKFECNEDSYRFVVFNKVKCDDETKSGLTKIFFDDINILGHSLLGHFEASIGSVSGNTHKAVLEVKR